MNIAVLKTGTPPGTLADTFGDYPGMFAQMLGDGFRLDTFDVENGVLPSDPSDYPGYIVTGSPAGVYDPLPWIAPLMEFIRRAGSSKLVGVCFGHQAMAEALGGKVEKSKKGWGAGLHRYTVVSNEPWIDTDGTISIPASHQDQVVEQPPNTRVVASSDFTPYAALAWTDRPAVSFQFHPEFTPGFAKALIEKRFDAVTNPREAIASLEAPNDNQQVAGWIRRFLQA